MSSTVRGRRDGTGPYRGSMRGAGTGRRAAGGSCPFAKDKPQPKIKIN